MPAQIAKPSSKRRKLAHESSDDEESSRTTSKKAQKAFFSNAASWKLEDDYESKRRKDKGKSKEAKNTKLPTRSSDGQVEALQRLEIDDNVSIESDTEWLDGKEEDVDLDAERPAREPKPTIPEPQQIREAQEELARVAGLMNENPEEHPGAFKAMAVVAQSTVPTVQMLALLTQMAVYKDVIPGYRIRSVLDESKKEQLSKEVRQLRQYERALMSGYQNYLKDLARHARSSTSPLPGGQSLSSIAISCAATLLISVPHFNFRGDLLKILVHRMSRRRVDADHIKCQEALETLFQDDDEGRPSLEAVSQLTRMMRSREWQVDESVLNLFLSLRLLSEFSGKGSQDFVEQTNGSRGRKKKEFRTKRERKALKEQKALDRDMTQADALVGHEERERMQSETLKLVFATYFRILKARVPHLMGAVLEGLAKYAHLINQDFFGDLLEALKDLIRHSDEDADEEFGAEEEGETDEVASATRNFNREALLCTVTAFALLSGQDAHNSRTALHLDLSYFTSHLYKTLLPMALQSDLERTDRVPSLSKTSKVNVQTTTVLLLRSLTSVLLPHYNMRSVPPLRLAAFTKQLMTTALQLPEKSCQGVLALLGDVAHTHGKKVASLWNTEERKGDGQFNALSDTAEGSNPYTATAWESELLKKHFSPKVREGVKLLEKSVTGL